MGKIKVLLVDDQKDLGQEIKDVLVCVGFRF